MIEEEEEEEEEEKVRERERERERERWATEKKRGSVKGRGGGQYISQRWGRG